MVNWLLLIAVVLLVIGFGTSSNLAAAYGIAVAISMFDHHLGRDRRGAAGLGLAAVEGWRWCSCR
jgi:KUP system potassium uptake protein